MLMILRVAEALGVGIAFAKALGWIPEQTTLGFSFRWHNLSGRQLTAWASPFSDFTESGIAYDEAIESCVRFSLDTPLSALFQFADEATKRLFAAFDGTAIPRRAVEELVKRLFERKLGF